MPRTPGEQWQDLAAVAVAIEKITRSSRKGALMSGINGDKSRFHRERKEKLARRIRNRKLFKGLPAPPKSVAAAPASKTEAVSA